MNVLLDQFIDLIFPPRCTICKKRGHAVICGDCAGKIEFLPPALCGICGKPKGRRFTEGICEDCAKERPAFAMARSAALYDGVIKQAMHKFKFGGKTALSPFFGDILFSYLSKGEMPLEEIDLVIPLPLSSKREKQRGYNQSMLLAEEISGRCSINIDITSLKKIRDVAPQFELSRKERLLNVKGAFRSAPLAGSTILLVDDIYTTGATAKEASQALKDAGAKDVYVLTLARAACPEGSKD